MSLSAIDQIIDQLRIMPESLQWQVLQFVHRLATHEIRGVPGYTLLRFAGTIPADDLQLMKTAIAENCERIDADDMEVSRIG